MLVVQRLLRAPTPPAASVLRPTGSVRGVTLVKPTKMAEGRITAAVVKAKLHILACDQPWAYGAIANSNAGNTDQATYTTPPSLDIDAAETWADAFRAASATLAPPGAANGTHAIAFATTAPPAARFEGLTQTIARVNAIESAFTEMARAQARTAGSIV